MLHKRIAAILLGCCLLAPLGGAADQSSTRPMVKMQTSRGDITIELYPEKAPETVDNFLQYADEGFYDGTVFHRVIPGFVLQGGGLTADMERKSTRAPVKNESDNGLLNRRSTLSMARLPDPHSATSQFFINLVDNSHLDHQGGDQWGYAVFAEVVDGMDVVDEIAAVETTTKSGYRDVPVTAVVIERVQRAD